ncbi:TetR/AcrR family transcriptional regulator [Vibrio sp. S4M6]|uniref:TetR/AcrR family transcriptional regulator n=1 Tax=Vibrio sinus TaxID=2946865 RepID=UPI002029B6D2|nr:TetR/AcrR family transcriptional regulator [Vibrio sinus]MCL9783178.1 TetR/AcrR family transcriptional regulator [Vibrio sinus]
MIEKATTEKKLGRRSAEDAEKTKHEILRVAMQLFCEEGYDKVSLRSISLKAHVSHSLIRHHFGSKEKIWHSISDRLHQNMASYITEILGKIEPDTQANMKLYLFTTHLLAHMLVYPRPIQLLADAVRQGDSLIEQFIDKAGNFQHFLTTLESEFNQQCPASPLNIREVKWQILLFAHGPASLSPFLEETWRDLPHDESLLKHWYLFESIMANTFNICDTQRSKPRKIHDLIYDYPFTLL